MLTGELAVPFYEPLYGAVGVEFDIAKTVFIQGGVQFKENPMVGMGLGYRRKDLNINVSYTPSMVFRNMMNVSVEFTFGDTKALENERDVERLLVEALESYNRGNNDEALGYIEKVLELESKNRRAKQLKKNIEKKMELDRSAEKVNGDKDKLIARSE